MTTPQQATTGAGYSSGTVASRFVWYDLMTTDLPRARAFYGALFGWEVRDIDMGPEAGVYPMIHVGEEGIGGMMALREPGVPSHWQPYITVTDVDASCARITELGGRVLHGPHDIPQVGRFAVVADPHGAVWCPFAPLPATTAPQATGPGTFAWNELLTPDPARGRGFYTALLGWTTTDHDMGPLGTYTIFAAAGTDVAGMLRMPDDAAGAPAHWLPYVAVDDVDASARRVTELGGTVYVQPTDIPDVGRFAVIADPTGATIALYKPLAS